MAASKPVITVPNLADLAEKFSIHYKHKPDVGYSERGAELSLTWIEILKIIGPEFRTPSNTSGVESALKQYMKDVLRNSSYSISFSMTDKERILNQMELLGFMKSAVYSLKNGGQSLFYTLTPGGVAEVLRLNAVTSSQAIPSR